MTPTRQKFITFRAVLAREMVRVFFIMRNQRWLVRRDPFAGEWGRGRRLHRSRLLLKILAKIAGGCFFVLPALERCRSGEPRGGLEPKFQLSFFMK